ncbi:ABC transporter substrate-binding protein [Actinomyces sp. B33]|uniref:ABC transporter substrate-binding protein n=1 Tax=Actinomyces sp. B33 TaxID=2942131 RepID=UPI002341F547|nr:ABC transporter substrate-binding protein [Actinomyces sp. B33]MDC4233374.1 ABC transporter substrate-binding protein [Actinomyces sp. B33]
MRTLPSLLSLTAITALALTGCADPDSTPAPSSAQSGSQSPATDIQSYDVSQIPVVDEIAALVPQEVKDRGTLRNGASTDYAPGEYRATDGQTPVGYDVDLTRALARVMGLDEGTTSHAEFPTIIPALGPKFDVGISSFTITPERVEQVNLISYIEVGSAYAVATGNPSGFDPADPCGTTIGVQNGTFQHDYAQELSDQCVADGKEPIAVMPLDLQTDVSTKVIGGQYDATFADSTVIGYTVELAGGKLEQIGDAIESAPQGIAVNKNDEALTAAVHAATQYLIDEGYLAKILGAYGAEDSVLPLAEINPAL